MCRRSGGGGSDVDGGRVRRIKGTSACRFKGGAGRGFRTALWAM